MAMRKRKCLVWRTRTSFAAITAPTETETGLYGKRKDLAGLMRDSEI
jgi:hypothetical protein